jgi:hypothetical protein
MGFPRGRISMLQFAAEIFILRSQAKVGLNLLINFDKIRRILDRYCHFGSLENGPTIFLA